MHNATTVYHEPHKKTAMISDESLAIAKCAKGSTVQWFEPLYKDMSHNQDTTHGPNCTEMCTKYT